MSGTVQQEERLGLSEVSDEISRVFFGKDIQSGRPSYSEGYQPGYGAPPALYPSRPGFGTTRLYRGYEDDIYLLVKLGHAALIIFMIFSVVSIVFMIITCCKSVLTGRKNKQEVDKPLPFAMPNKQDSTPPARVHNAGPLQRSTGVSNLLGDSDSNTTEEINTVPSRSRARKENDPEDRRTPDWRFNGTALTPQIPQSGGHGEGGPRESLYHQTGPRQPLYHRTNNSSYSDISQNRSYPDYEVFVNHATIRDNIH